MSPSLGKVNINSLSDVVLRDEKNYSVPDFVQIAPQHYCHEFAMIYCAGCTQIEFTGTILKRINLLVHVIYSAADPQCKQSGLAEE